MWSEKMPEMISLYLNFTKAWFIAQDVIYPEEISMCIWEKRWHPLILGEMSYTYKLGLTGPLCHLNLVVPC